MTMKLYAPRGTDLSPLREFATLGNRLGSLFEDHNTRRGTGWAPAVNIEDTAEAIVLTAEAPGLTLDDLSVELENNLLTISGDKREQLEEGVEDRRFHLGERRFGSFRRSFRLPVSVDAEHIDARFENGILAIRLPKAAEAKSRTIEVK